jgi:hypothetical protein
MGVDAHGLRAGQEIRLGIQMLPARLHPAKSRPRHQRRNRPAEKVGRRNKIRIKDCHEFRGVQRETVLQRSCFEAAAHRTPHHRDVHLPRTPVLGPRIDNLARFVRRIIEHLNAVPAV